MLRYCVIFTRDTVKSDARHFFGRSALALALGLLLAACQSSPTEKTGNGHAQAAGTPQVSSNDPAVQPPSAATASASASSTPGSAPASSPATAPNLPHSTAAFLPVHIKAGEGDSFTDSAGNVWQTDQGFDGGQTVARPDLEI